MLGLLHIFISPVAGARCDRLPCPTLFFQLVLMTSSGVWIIISCVLARTGRIPSCMLVMSTPVWLPNLQTVVVIGLMFVVEEETWSAKQVAKFVNQLLRHILVVFQCTRTYSRS